MIYWKPFKQWPPPSSGDELLRTNERLVSPGGAYNVGINAVGQLIVAVHNSNPVQVVWNIDPDDGPQPESYVLGVNPDGTLQLNRGNGAAQRKVWISGPPVGMGSYFLQLQDDANLVLTEGTPAARGRAVWSKFTGPIAAPAPGGGGFNADIPFAFWGPGWTISGLVHARENLADTWVEGWLVGAVNGTFHLSRGDGAIDIYAGPLAKIAVAWNGDNAVMARFDTLRIWDGKWNEGSWLDIVSW